MAKQELRDLWTMTAQQELFSNTGIHLSRTLGYPPLKCYSTAASVTCHPNPDIAV